MAFKFTFSIEKDVGIKTSNPGTLAESVLVSEIAQSTITIALAGLSRAGDVLVVQFKADLPPEQEDTLKKTVIPNHNKFGKPPGGVDQSGAFLVAIDGPRDAEDKKPIVVVSPATQGFNTWVTGAADDLDPTAPATGRGEGPRFRLDFPGPGTELGEYRFSEPIEIHSGQVQWTGGWGADDDFSLGVRCPKTPSSKNSDNEGNANLITTGLGFKLIVPALGDGTHNVNLDKAVPVRAFDENNMPNGHWDVVHNTGEVKPSSTPGGARWNLINAEIVAWLIRRVAMAHPGGCFDINAYKIDYLHPSYTLLWEVVKKTAGTGTATGWVLAFRRHAG